MQTGTKIIGHPESRSVRHLWNRLGIALLATLLLSSGAYGNAVRPSFAVSADGGRITYYPMVKAGTVPIIVLSGGPGSDSRYMRVGGGIEALARSRTIVFYDQRGTSRSTDSNGSETVEQYVEDIDAIRKAIGAAKVDLLGHSFGGYLAMAYTTKYPQAVRGLILVDSSAPKPGDSTQLMDALFPDRIDAWREKRATLGERAIGADVAIFQTMEFVNQQKARQFIDAVTGYRYNLAVNNTIRTDMARRDYWPAVKSLRHPALILHGRYDAIIAPSTSWRLHRAMANSIFRIIEEAGHLPHIERPDAFLSMVRPFLHCLDQSGSSSAGSARMTERVAGDRLKSGCVPAGD